MVIFGSACACAQEREVARVDRAFPGDAAVDRWPPAARRARRLRLPAPRTDVAELAIEIAVIGGAAELAVGGKPQSDALLQAHASSIARSSAAVSAA